MRELPKTYRQAGMNMTVIHRDGDYAVACADPADPESYHEVFRVMAGGVMTKNGKSIEVGEHVPSSNQWGTFGWSYSRFGAKKPSEGQTAREAAWARLAKCLALVHSKGQKRVGSTRGIPGMPPDP